MMRMPLYMTTVGGGEIQMGEVTVQRVAPRFLPIPDGTPCTYKYVITKRPLRAGASESLSGQVTVPYGDAILLLEQVLAQWRIADMPNKS